MKFSEKLRRRAAEINKSKAAKAVGLGPTTISNYIAKGSVPRADIALKIARALEVPLDWLADDAQDWPPPAPAAAPSLSTLDDGELMLEVARRWASAHLDLLTAIRDAEGIEWTAVQNSLRNLPEGTPYPPALEQIRLIVTDLEAAFIRASSTYNPAHVAKKYQLHGATPAGIFDDSQVLQRIFSLRRLPGFSEARRRALLLEAIPGEQPYLTALREATRAIQSVTGGVHGEASGKAPPPTSSAHPAKRPR